jgi:hypothetical protein
MRLLSVVTALGLIFSTASYAGEKESFKVPSPPVEKAKPQADKAPKQKRKGARFDLKKSREFRGRLFRDWDSGLQFSVSKGKLHKLKQPKDAKGIRWETQVSVGSITVRMRSDAITPGDFRSGPELVAYLEELSAGYRDGEIEPREVVVLGSDMLDGMGTTEAGASVDVVLPKGKYCCEQLWVLTKAGTRVTINIRYTGNDLRRGRWIKFQNKFLEGLKIANTDYWK